MEERDTDTISISHSNAGSLGDSMLNVAEYINLKAVEKNRVIQHAHRASTIHLNVFKELDQQLKAKDFDKVKLENGRLTDLLFDRILLIEKSMVAFSLMAIVICILEVSSPLNQYHLEFALDPKTDVDDKSGGSGTYNLQKLTDLEKIRFLLYIVMMITPIIVVLNLLRQYLYFRFKQVKKMYSIKKNLWTWSRIINLFIQSLLILVHPNILLLGNRVTMYNKTVAAEIYYNYNDVALVFQYYKVFIIFRGLLNNTYYSSNRAYRICGMYGCKPSQMFVIKAYMKNHPISFVMVMLLTGIIMFAYLLMIAEAPLSRIVQDMNHSSFFNCCWEVILVMTTGKRWPLTQSASGTSTQGPTSAGWSSSSAPSTGSPWSRSWSSPSSTCSR